MTYIQSWSGYQHDFHIWHMPMLPRAELCTISAINVAQHCKSETDGMNRLRMSCFSQTQFAQPSSLGPLGQHQRMEAGKYECFLE